MHDGGTNVRIDVFGRVKGARCKYKRHKKKKQHHRAVVIAIAIVDVIIWPLFSTCLVMLEQLMRAYVRCTRRVWHPSSVCAAERG